MSNAKSGVGHFSGYVESLLAADLEPREQSVAAEKAVNEQAIDALAALYNSEGSLSEEFQEF